MSLLIRGNGKRQREKATGKLKGNKAVNDMIANKLEDLEQWRKKNLERLDTLHQWFKANNLESNVAEAIFLGILARLHSSELKIAFIGDFSRGKSELINAIFFANGKKRIMPVSVGRTTMCAVDIGYDKSFPPSIRLLPLHTRLQDVPLLEWKDEKYKDIWVTEELDIDNTEQLIEMIGRVSERRLVPPSEAADLGLWDMENPQNNPPTNALGLLEVPKWRYAVLNYPHPLLKRGISIIDTPGLNATGAELELTLELLPQTHVIMHVLQADTGVTRTDMQLWQDHLSKAHMADRPSYILLNKIDMLQDHLLKPEEVEAQLQQQIKTCSAMLNIPMSKIFPVSARYGLAGKVNNDTKLLESSRILDIERMLVGEMLPKRQQILQQALGSGLGELYSSIINRLKDKAQVLDQQLEELQEFKGKNDDVAKNILRRLQEREKGLHSLRKRASEMRILENRALNRMTKFISHDALDTELVELSVGINNPNMKVSLTKSFEKTIHMLRVRAKKFEAMAQEFETLVLSHMEELETEFGIDLIIPPGPGAGSLVTDIDLLENRHEIFFSTNQMIKLRKAQQTSRIYQTLLTRIRSIFDEAHDMLSMWSKNSYNLLVAKVSDLEDSTQDLFQSIKSIRTAKEPLNKKIEQMEKERHTLFNQQHEFEKIMQEFDQFSPAWIKSITAVKSKPTRLKRAIKPSEQNSIQQQESGIDLTQENKHEHEDDSLLEPSTLGSGSFDDEDEGATTQNPIEEQEDESSDFSNANNPSNAHKEAFEQEEADENIDTDTKEAALEQEAARLTDAPSTQADDDAEDDTNADASADTDHKQEKQEDQSIDGEKEESAKEHSNAEEIPSNSDEKQE